MSKSCGGWTGTSYPERVEPRSLQRTELCKRLLPGYNSHRASGDGHLVSKPSICLSLLSQSTELHSVLTQHISGDLQLLFVSVGCRVLLPSPLGWAASIIQIGCVSWQQQKHKQQHRPMLLRGSDTQRRPQLHFWWSVPKNDTSCFKHEPKSDWTLRRATFLQRSEHLTDIQEVYWRPRSP